MLHSGERAASMIRWSSLPLEKPEDLPMPSLYVDSVTFDVHVIAQEVTPPVPRLLAGLFAELL
jgi:hypothetical protein